MVASPTQRGVKICALILKLKKANIFISFTLRSEKEKSNKCKITFSFPPCLGGTRECMSSTSSAPHFRARAKGAHYRIFEQHAKEQSAIRHTADRHMRAPQKTQKRFYLVITIVNCSYVVGIIPIVWNGVFVIVFFLKVVVREGTGSRFLRCNLARGRFRKLMLCCRLSFRATPEEKEEAIDRNDLSLLLLQFEEGPRGIS